MPEIDLLVLASSRKHGGRCVAGWDMTNDHWLRPVSTRVDGTLQLRDCAIDGRWPEPFDVVHIEVGEHRPTPYQPENWVIADQDWELVETVDPASVRGDLRGRIDHNDWLLRSSNRQVEAAALRQNAAATSLILVEPSSLSWRIETPPWGTQRKANFQVDGRGWYDFSVTDISVFESLRGLDDGGYARSTVGIADDSDVFLTVSLSEPYDNNDRCYKLVAAVIEIPV